ncbi:MAG TPA: hypothetical protein VGH87_05310 [Polyangiaceae bacterium]
MGMLTDFYVAPRSAAKDILAGKAAKLKKLESKSIDEVKLASLEKITAKALGAKVKAGESKLLTDEDGEQWVFLVSPSLVDLLVKAGDETASIAKAWAATEEAKRDGWRAADVKKLVDRLVELAADAKKSGKDLLLFMSL